MSDGGVADGRRKFGLEVDICDDLFYLSDALMRGPRSRGLASVRLFVPACKTTFGKAVSSSVS